MASPTTPTIGELFPWFAPVYESESESVTSPDPVDYSDIVDDSQIPDQETIEANMSYYLVRSGKVHVKENNQLWEVDVDSASTGLYRQNAMTYYEELTPYLILARNVENHDQLFYLVKCLSHPRQWVQVDLDTGDNIYNIQKN
jgi:hypothetical protein